MFRQAQHKDLPIPVIGVASDRQGALEDGVLLEVQGFQEGGDGCFDRLNTSGSPLCGVPSRVAISNPGATP
jgi:hypothetical protein